MKIKQKIERNRSNNKEYLSLSPYMIPWFDEQIKLNID